MSINTNEEHFTLDRHVIWSSITSKGKSKNSNLAICDVFICLNFYFFSLTGSLESDSHHWEIMGVYDRIAGAVKQSLGMLFSTQTPHWPVLIPGWITRQQRCWIFHKHLILCMWIFLLHFVCSPRQQQWDKTGFYQFIVFPLAKVSSRELLLFTAKLLHVRNETRQY